jgi:hypothetical protein
MPGCPVFHLMQVKSRDHFHAHDALRLRSRPKLARYYPGHYDKVRPRCKIRTQDASDQPHDPPKLVATYQERAGHYERSDADPARRGRTLYLDARWLLTLRGPASLAPAHRR